MINQKKPPVVIALSELHLRSNIVQGLMHGHGILYLRGGRKYVGEWRFGQREGNGKMIYPAQGAASAAGVATSATYDGSWKGGQRHGIGVLASADGARSYAGGWIAGRRSGKGVQHYSNGDHYDGAFGDDRRHGVGRATFRLGAIASFDGTWADDEPVEGKLVYRNGDTYCGALKHGLPHGSGVLTLANNVIVSGRFADGTYAPNAKLCINLPTGKRIVFFVFQ